MKPVAALAAVALLTGCAEEKAPEPSPAPTPTVAEPRTLIAADLELDSLGARMALPGAARDGFAVVVDGKDIARITSYVACPEEMTRCVPGELPQSTVLTYVHTISPPAAPSEANATPTTAPTAAARPVSGALFRMTRPAPGFNGGVGYSLAEAEAALGSPDAITITLDAGELIWRVTGGEGLTPGAPLTVWWQTTVPPADTPQSAYQLELGGKTVPVTGPFPAADKPVDPAPTR